MSLSATTSLRGMNSGGNIMNSIMTHTDFAYVLIENFNKKVDKLVWS